MENQPLQVRLTGRAAKFVQVLKDWGHLDEEGINQLLALVAELHGTPTGATADLSAVKRAATILMFDAAGMSEQDRLLNEDWSLLFS